MLFIPIGDDLRLRGLPVVTLALIAANIVVFGYQLSLGPGPAQRLVLAYGMIPLRLFADVVPPPGAIDPWASIVTSMFLHGSLAHLASNMLFLWIFGANVEEAAGPLRFLTIYLVAGAVAAVTHAALAPDSRVPMIGASGAIAAVLGSYLLLFPGAMVRVLFWMLFFVRIVLMPAVLWILAWLVVQIVAAILSDPDVPGIAWYAHLGGFFAGIVLLALLFPDWRRVRTEITRDRR